MENRTVITGFGLKLPKINNVEQFEKVVKQGTCTQSIVTGIGPKKESLVYGIIEDELEEVKEKSLRGYPRASLLGIAATKEAIQRAKLTNPKARLAVIMGTSTASLPEVEQSSYLYRNNHYNKICTRNAGMTNNIGLDLQDTNEAKNQIRKLGNHTPITSIKGRIGHTFAVSGVVQLISSVLSIRGGYIPATTHSDFVGYEHVNIVKETYCDVQHIAITSHGYGGNNNTIVVSKVG